MASKYLQVFDKLNDKQTHVHIHTGPSPASRLVLDQLFLENNYLVDLD